MKTIYVSITSLDDSELIPTVLGAFENASTPERVFVGVHLWASPELKNEFSEKLSKYANNIRFKFDQMSEESFAQMSGVGKGRRRALNLYKNEDYLLQIDSHSLFAKTWYACGRFSFPACVLSVSIIAAIVATDPDVPCILFTRSRTFDG